ncbi:MAG: MprA protease, GlyGly-CTERM protein-sorting domain-containing form [Huintestinicola sp.]
MPLCVTAGGAVSPILAAALLFHIAKKAQKFGYFH